MEEGHTGRVSVLDEKGAKFTGRSKDLFKATKPENKVVSWTSDKGFDTKFNETYVAMLKQHRYFQGKKQSVFDEYVKESMDIDSRIGGPV